MSAILVHTEKNSCILFVKNFVMTLMNEQNTSMDKNIFKKFSYEN